MLAKQKGSKFERKVASEIRKSGLDKKARRRPLSGSEKMVKGYADLITKLPFSFELKKQERTVFWKWWEQAEDQASMNRPPILVHSANYRPIMASMTLKTFLNLLQEIQDWKMLAKEKVK